MSMEASEIIRRNEAIARFMGLTCPPTYDGPNSIGRGYYDPNELRYHDEYQWLMTVVDRIVIQAGFSYHVIRDDFGDGTLYKVGFDPEHYGMYIRGVLGYGKTMIEATFLAVSDYCLALES